MNRYKLRKIHFVTNVIFIGAIVLLIIGYFLQTILIPIQDIDIFSAEELLELQKKMALNYPLGKGLMLLGGVGAFCSIGLYIYFLVYYLYNKINENKKWNK